MQNRTNGSIAYEIAKGAFSPDIRLTNVAMAYFQSLNNRPAKTLFPIVPVDLSTASYYIFDKGDLLRDNVRRKPQFGKVDPAHISHRTATYNCEVDQIILGIDQISQVNYQRAGIPAFLQKENQKSRTIAQQMAIHQDIMFANAYFKAGVWANEWTGKDSANEDAHEFVKFSDANSTPIQFFRDRITDMLRQTGRKPNKLGLGMNTYNALLNHPDILARIDGNASSDNPAMANEAVLAKLFGVAKVVVFEAIANNAHLGQDDDMNFICDENAALLVYAPEHASIEEPSAGYIFTWDMLGNRQYLPVQKGLGEFATHSEYIEGLMSYDMRKTADDLGMFFAECV